MSRKLHIGGTTRVEGWEILNAIPGPDVDHVCNANDLSDFDDNTFSALYASHVAEHFDFRKELLNALKEWHRVLKPGGTAYISVPDLDILAALFISKNKYTINERFFLMRMIFGGHMDEYDYHLVGLNEDFLSFFLRDAGFINIRKVKDFGLFDDTSSVLYKGVAISLNMIAEKSND